MLVIAHRDSAPSHTKSVRTISPAVEPRPPSGSTSGSNSLLTWIHHMNPCWGKYCAHDVEQSCLCTPPCSNCFPSSHTSHAPLAFPPATVAMLHLLSPQLSPPAEDLGFRSSEHKNSGSQTAQGKLRVATHLYTQQPLWHFPACQLSLCQELESSCLPLLCGTRPQRTTAVSMVASGMIVLPFNAWCIGIFC